VLGADGLVTPLESGSGGKAAYSNFGPYFERGPARKYSLFRRDQRVVQLTQLKVLTGVYDKGEEIPYAEAVMDFASGYVSFYRSPKCLSPSPSFLTLRLTSQAS
jgi:hypothetical protein